MKDKIVQAVYQEMIHSGLKFTIREIANRMGISTKTIYQHFASKEQIIDYMVEQSISEMKRSEQQIMNQDELSHLDKLKQVLTIAPQAWASFDMHMLKEMGVKYPASWDKIDTYMNQGWQQIRLLIQAGISQGDFREFDIELFIQVYLGAMYQLINQRATRVNPWTAERAIVQTTEFLLEGIYKRSKHE
jgi:AcrR family transcriptional regulator